MDDGPKFTCNECEAIIPVQDVQRVVLEMESTEATCPHCGQASHIDGFSEVFAFVCRHCQKGVGL
jgi:DNA-directed RNA polymerase subunit RPC12/RpoP